MGNDDSDDDDGNVNNVRRMKESVIDERFKIEKDNGKL